MNKIYLASFLLLIGCSNPESINNVIIKDNQILANLTDSITLRHMEKICNKENCRIEKSKQQSKYDSIHSDTIISFNFKYDTISFYKSNDNVFLLNFIIKSPLIQLGKNIKVGESKDEIAKQFNVKDLKTDTIFIETDMFVSSTNVMKLIFKDDKLNKITFYSIPD